MPEWSFLIVIALACLIPGWLLVALFARPARPTLPMLFAALTLGVVIIGWLALILAELHLFSIGRLTLLWLILTALLFITHWSRRSNSPLTISPVSQSPSLLVSNLPRWAESLFLALWLIAALWLFFRPHEYILGGADAGVYVSLGASIAQSGGIIIQDETLVAMDAALYPAFLRPLPQNPIASSYLFPGFYIIGEPPGEITPQFYPLHPVWQAIAYGLATAVHQSVEAGVRAELLLPGLWALLGALAVYLTVREFAGWETAALALTGLTISALQVWFARYPTTESFTQYLLWAGLWALAMWLGGRGPRPLWALVAGISLGEIFVLRIDMIAILPLLGLLLLWLLLSRQPARGWFIVPLVVLIGHSLLHAFWQSRPYAYDLFGLTVLLLRNNWWIPLGGVLIGLAFLWAVWRTGPRLAGIAGQYRRLFLGLLLLVTLLVAIHGWFIRPLMGETVLRQDGYSQQLIPLTEHENWRRLGWYLSPVGVWLGVAGTCLLFWKVNRRTAVMLAVGALFSLLYLWNLRANPHHIYAMRRYVPAVLPFFVLAAAVFIQQVAMVWRSRGAEAQGGRGAEGQRSRGELIGKWRLSSAYFFKGAAVLLALIWLAGLAWSARGFVSQVDHAGLIEQIAALDRELEADSILIFNDQAVVSLGDIVGTPLKFIYGHDVFTLRDPAALDERLLAQTLQIWENSDRAVYWVGDPAWLVEHGFGFSTAEQLLQSTYLENSYEHKPQRIEQQEWRLLLNKLTNSP